MGHTCGDECANPSRYHPQGARDRAEAYELPLADVLTIDLEGHWPVRPQGQLRLVMEGQDAAPAWRPARPPQHLPHCHERSQGAQLAEGEDIKTRVKVGLRVGLHRAFTQVGPWRCVRDYSQE